MAEDLKKENEIKEVVTKTSVLQENETLQSVVSFFKKYQMYFGIAVAAVLLFILYQQFFGKKTNLTKELNADRIIQGPLYNMSRDSFDIALNGDSATEGLLSIIKKNDNTKIADQARLHAAICYLKTSKPKDAIKMLEKASGFGKQINARRLSLLGDAQSELGTENGTVNKKLCEDAVNYYEKAANEFSEDDMAAVYLFKAAELQLKIGNTDAAKKIFVKIKDKYPDYQQMIQVEKALGKLGAEN